MKQKYIEWKLSLLEKEIQNWETKENTATVNLRQCKQKQWELINQLEKADKE